ncbi:MAG: hypothetical protein J5736_01085, partial [Bacilli bacterium]|nr:hypothetical protein [Bacilli bacterium]
QTFYYHYQDIYDLIADILLSESLEAFEKTKTITDSCQQFLLYLKENFDFYRTTYLSSAKDLPDDFIFDKLRAKFLTVLSKERKKFELKKISECRAAARRFARIVSDEFGDRLKEAGANADKFNKKMTIYLEKAERVLFPAILTMSREEEK